MLLWVTIILAIGSICALVPVTHKALTESGVIIAPLFHVFLYGVVITVGVFGGWFAGVAGSIAFITHIAGCEMEGVCGEGYVWWVLISGTVGAIIATVGCLCVLRRILSAQQN